MCQQERDFKTFSSRCHAHSSSRLFGVVSRSGWACWWRAPWRACLSRCSATASALASAHSHHPTTSVQAPPPSSDSAPGISPCYHVDYAGFWAIQRPLDRFRYFFFCLKGIVCPHVLKDVLFTFSTLERFGEQKTLNVGRFCSKLIYSYSMTSTSKWHH